MHPIVSDSLSKLFELWYEQRQHIVLILRSNSGGILKAKRINKFVRA